MSGKTTYESSATFTDESYATAKGSKREVLLEAREDRVETLRASMSAKAAAPVVRAAMRDIRAEVDERLVRNTITQPATDAEEAFVILVDNSGSNRTIARHIRGASNYWRVNMGLSAPRSATVWVYFSDHCDREKWWQSIDFVPPTADGEKILESTLFCRVEDADGGDAPEAHECALWEATKIAFGGIPRGNRHLILVSDVAGHGMGMAEDGGCPFQRSWKDSVVQVEQTYGSFEVVGCGDNPRTAQLQALFISHQHPERVAVDFVSLAHVKDNQHRLGLVLNSVLFLVARHHGNQSLEAFLSRLFEKWLDEPLFGGQTELRARQAILRFAKYIPQSSDDRRAMMSRVLVTSLEEIDRLVAEGGVEI